MLTKKRFRNKILQALLLLTALPLLAWGFFTYQKALANHTGAYELRLREAAESLRQQTDQWQADNIDLLHVLEREISTTPQSQWQDEIRNIVPPDASVIAQIDDVSGRNLYRSDSVEPHNYADREYFRRAVRGEFFSEVVITRAYGKPALCSAAPVVRDHVVRQVVVLCSFMDRVAELFRKAATGATDHQFLIDENGRIMAHSHLGFMDKPRNPEDNLIILRAQGGQIGSLNVQDENGNAYAGYVTSLGNGWKVISVQSRDEITNLSQRSLIWPFVTGFLMVVALVILNSVFVDRTTAPLDRLTRVVRSFGQGDLNVRAQVESNDELGVLAVSFNLMAAQISATIEELKAKEQLLARHRDELHQKVSQQSQKLLYSAKMSSLGEMAGGIAHEVNNPLAIISLKAQKIQEGLLTKRLTADEAGELAAQIEETCMRIHKIIRGLKTFSRDGSRDPMISENLRTILTETENLCGESLRARGIHLEIQCSDETWIDCQPVQISQLLLNLIMNSRDVVATLTERWIRLEVVAGDNDVLIRVTDSGRGIPEPVRSQMMQPFFTTKRVGEGTGLGLSICSGIVDHHQGTLIYNLDSERTQFLIRLPRHQKKNSAMHVAWTDLQR